MNIDKQAELEIWKPVVNYKGIYEVSNYGKVKSLERFISYGNEKRISKERILKPCINSNGYCAVVLCINGNHKTRKVHQLVTESFLNHKPNGNNLVVDHIDHNKVNNILSNLRIITHRENSSYKKKRYSSKYAGVSWRKDNKKWQTTIYIDKKLLHIGYYEYEYDAHLAYQDKLKTFVK